MKAVVWHGKKDVRVDTVPDPKIEDPRDAIIRITSTAICGSDLHLYNGVMAGMKKGDIIGHEPMGIVEEVGASVTNLKKGDKVVVPFTISCGSCHFCERSLYSLCDESNPNQELARGELGHATAALFGYSHLTGGIPGGQAEYLRVPYADVGPIKVPDDLADEQVLFLSDIFPTGWMAADNCDIAPGDTVAVWGCGPVGLFAIKSVLLQGAARVIAIDSVDTRLKMASSIPNVEIIDRNKDKPYEALMEMTSGMGPDKCIDAVGAEAHSSNSLVNFKEGLKQRVGLADNRDFVINEAIQSCKKGGIISVPGVYTDEVPGLQFGAAMNKALTIKLGQTHVQRYLPELLNLVIGGKIDLSFPITHTLSLEEAPKGYEIFNDKKDECVKVVLKA